MRFTLEDVAARTRRSKATVSRVLNNYDKVSEATRREVLRAVDELQCQSSVGRRRIGLIVPDPQNPYFSTMAYACDRECERYGTHLMISSSDGRAHRELDLLKHFTELEVDGIIFISAGRNNAETLLTLRHSPVKGVPLVALDRGPSHIDRVTTSTLRSVNESINCLVAYGHTDIGYIKGQAGTETADERVSSFCNAMSASGLGLKSNWISEGDYRVESGRRYAELLLGLRPEDRPTAVLAANDLMAIGLVTRLQCDGWRLPEDLSVIGFDGIPECTWIVPGLSTIQQPVTKLAHHAVSIVMKRIQEREQRLAPSEPMHIQMQTRFVPRQSIGYARSSHRFSIVGA